MSWSDIQKSRIERFGRFGWFLAQDGHTLGCSCFFCAVWSAHNLEIWEELCAEYGWDADVPTGDTPMTP